MPYLKFQPIFKARDGNTKKQTTGRYLPIEVNPDTYIHQDLPGEITVISCVVDNVKAPHCIDWVFIKNGPAGPLTFYARFGIWDATVRITLDPEMELLLPDISCEHFTPHLDNADSDVIFTWPCEPVEEPKDPEEFLHLKPGVGTWDREVV